VLDAVGRDGDAGDVRNSGDGAERFSGLLVGGDGSVGAGVDAREVLGFTLAGLEDVLLSVVGCVEGASDAVEDVLAVAGGVGAGRVADFEAELVGSHEVVPFDTLDRFSGELVRVDDASHGVTAGISTMGVHLTSVITIDHVDLGLVDKADDLDVVGGLHELNTLQCAFGNETGAVTWLGAPGDHFTFDVADFVTRFGRCPEAEVFKAVEPRSLAEGFLVFSGAIADVVSLLETTDEVGVGIDLERDSVRILEWALLSERNRRVCGQRRGLRGDERGCRESESYEA